MLERFRSAEILDVVEGDEPMPGIVGALERKNATHRVGRALGSSTTRPTLTISTSGGDFSLFFDQKQRGELRRAFVELSKLKRAEAQVAQVVASNEEKPPNAPSTIASPTSREIVNLKDAASGCLVAWLKERDFRYTVSDRGVFSLKFSASPERPEFGIWFGIEDSELQYVAKPTEPFPVESRSRLLEECNTWNRERKWPKAFVAPSTGSADSFEVRVESWLFLEGLSNKAFDLFFNSRFGATRKFIQSLQEHLPG